MPLPRTDLRRQRFNLSELDRVSLSRARAVGLLAPGCDDCRFYLFGQLVGVSKRPSRPIAQALQIAFFIALKDLIAGLPGNAEFAAQRSHAFPVFEPDHKAHSFVHHRTFLPWHPHFPPPAG
jgi:hypothetical protein